MNEEKVISHGMFQNVIWHFTNKHQIASVFSNEVDKTTTDKIHRAICKLENIKPSWYKISYAASQNGDNLQFSGIPEIVHGNLEFVNPTRKNLNVEFTDASGKVINTLEVYIDYPAGNTKIPVKLNVSNLSKGDYIIRVVDENNRILKDWKVDVG
jgi:hypothetical protein